MRLIDADALIERLKKDNPQTSKLKWAQIVADNVPTIEAEPVVRCKDCDRGFGSPVCPIQSKGWAINKDTFFCAWGERREP